MAMVFRKDYHLPKRILMVLKTFSGSILQIWPKASHLRRTAILLCRCMRWHLWQQRGWHLWCWFARWWHGRCRPWQLPYRPYRCQRGWAWHWRPWRHWVGHWAWGHWLGQGVLEVGRQKLLVQIFKGLKRLMEAHVGVGAGTRGEGSRVSCGGGIHGIFVPSCPILKQLLINDSSSIH